MTRESNVVLVVERFPVSGRKRDAPEVGRSGQKLHRNHVAFGRFDRSADDAAFHLLLSPIILQLEGGTRGHGLRAQQHGAVVIYGNGGRRKLDVFPRDNVVHRYRNPNHHALTAPAFFARNETGPAASIR